MLTGVVLDDSRYALPGASVAVRDETLGTEITAVTDINGAFSIELLREGVYRVEASLGGFEPAVMQHVTLKQSVVARANVTLRLDTRAYTITVGDVAPVGATTNSDVSTTITQDLISKLPH